MGSVPAYVPTEWKTGDVVSSAGLNKIENRVAEMGGDCILFVNIQQRGAGNSLQLDKTYNEILAAVQSGNKIIVFVTEMDGVLFFLYDFTIGKNVQIGDPGISVSNRIFRQNEDGYLWYYDSGITPV